MSNAARFKNVTLGPAGFRSRKSPTSGPKRGAVDHGVVWLARAGGGFARWPSTPGVLSRLHERQGYLAPAMLVPLAAGSCPSNGFSRVRVPRLSGESLGGMLAAIVPLPVVVPLLSPDRLGVYMSTLGVAPEQAERSELGVLPQHFADRFGWEELTSITATAWDSLTPDEQTRAIIVTSNYGEAGALRYYGRARGLPPATSQHNNFYLWGPGNSNATIVVAVGMSPKDLEPVFSDVRTTSKMTNPFAMPYEREYPVTICRDPKISLSEAWVRGKLFI